MERINSMSKYAWMLALSITVITAAASSVRAADQPAAATWYLAQLNFDDPSAISAISDYKGTFDSIVAGAFANPAACETVKAQFIEIQKKAGECSDAASCKSMEETFNKALQCVPDSDPRWGDTPPEKRWFLFFGAIMPEGKCRSEQQMLAGRVASVFSSPDESTCKSKGKEYAESMLGKPSERPSPTTPDCTYCIRGDDPLLRSQP
jgi:hypothetical protein